LTAKNNKGIGGKELISVKTTEYKNIANEYLTILINPTKMKMKTKAMTFGKCLWKVIRCPEV